MVAAGRSISEIARAIGTNWKTVRRHLREHNIQYARFRQAGQNNPAWKGGRMIDKRGYVLIWMPDHPEANRHGQVREHRLVMEGVLGRRLNRKEVVHHKNCMRNDNRPENLEIYGSNADHLRAELTGVPCPARGRKHSPIRRQLAHDDAMLRQRSALGQFLPGNTHRHPSRTADLHGSAQASSGRPDASPAMPSLQST